MLVRGRVRGRVRRRGVRQHQREAAMRQRRWKQQSLWSFHQQKKILPLKVRENLYHVVTIVIFSCCFQKMPVLFRHQLLLEESSSSRTLSLEVNIPLQPAFCLIILPIHLFLHRTKFYAHAL